jgi:ferredoxin
MGVEAKPEERHVAYVKCGGSFADAVFRYDYFGIADCGAVSMLAGGGSKQCAYGCLGSGSCVRACRFGALSIVGGIAVVDPEKCVSCGLCIAKCPRKLIELVPYDANYRVGCNSRDAGKTVRENCRVGCIGCKLCEKVCGFNAIHVENNLAKIDYSNCTLCGECVKKCPMKCIKLIEVGDREARAPDAPEREGCHV